MGVYAIVIGIGSVQIMTLMLCGVLWWFLVRQERSLQLLSTKLKERGEAEASHESPQPELTQQKPDEFGRQLREAELKASLQMAVSTQQNPMDKYKYVASMADKGLGVEDLAQSFGISSYEAEQLVNLSRMANSGAEG